MYPTSTRPDRRDAPDHSPPTPGVQVVLLALFAGGLWAVSYPLLALVMLLVFAAVVVAASGGPETRRNGPG